MDDKRLCLVVLGTAILGALYGLVRAYTVYIVRKIRREERALRKWQTELEMCAHDVRAQTRKKSRDWYVDRWVL